MATSFMVHTSGQKANRELHLTQIDLINCWVLEPASCVQCCFLSTRCVFVCNLRGFELTYLLLLLNVSIRLVEEKIQLIQLIKSASERIYHLNPVL